MHEEIKVAIMKFLVTVDKGFPSTIKTHKFRTRQEVEDFLIELSKDETVVKTTVRTLTFMNDNEEH